MSLGFWRTAVSIEIDPQDPQEDIITFKGNPLAFRGKTPENRVEPVVSDSETLISIPAEAETEREIEIPVPQRPVKKLERISAAEVVPSTNNSKPLNEWPRFDNESESDFW